MKEKVCLKCGDCCRNLIVRWQFDLHPYEIEFLKARGLKVDRRSITLDMVCPHLTADNLCDIHAYKPVHCRETTCKKTDKEREKICARVRLKD